MDVRKTTAFAALIVGGLLPGAPVDAPRAENLYNPDSFRSLASDRRAYRAGDLLTVLVVESSSASTSADTTSDKSVNAGAALQTPSSNKAYAVELNDDFGGRGRIQRSGKLLAQLTVAVQSIDANGQLVIKGEQVIDVNDEKQGIRLEGRVRPSDILENNTVLSTRIGDAKIGYIGEGLLADSQRPGLITRFLRWLGIP